MQPTDHMSISAPKGMPKTTCSNKAKNSFTFYYLNHQETVLAIWKDILIGQVYLFHLHLRDCLEQSTQCLELDVHTHGALRTICTNKYRLHMMGMIGCHVVTKVQHRWGHVITRKVSGAYWKMRRTLKKSLPLTSTC